MKRARHRAFGWDDRRASLKRPALSVVFSPTSSRTDTEIRSLLRCGQTSLAAGDVPRGRPVSVRTQSRRETAMSLLIEGGRIVDGAQDFVGDVLIEGETIAALGESIQADADRRIDATGLYVIPGAIDPHTHMEMPFGGTVSRDDFSSGTIAAAFGGTTTI